MTIANRFIATKRFRKLLAAVSVAAASAGLMQIHAVADNPPCQGQSSRTATSCTFTATNQPASFLVPFGVTSLQIVAVGASGANSSAPSQPLSPHGGNGARISATIPASQNSVLDVGVDVEGGSGDGFGGNGGGMSEVNCSFPGENFPGCPPLGVLASFDLVVAGGGGGASATFGGGGGAGGALGGTGACAPATALNGNGGDGGAALGDSGQDGQQCNAAGAGGLGGATATYAPVCAGGGGGGGGVATGGAGGDCRGFVAVNQNAPSGSESGGGGGGYGGGSPGGAGSQTAVGSSGGGGGSSFADAEASNVTLSDAQGATPFVTISWATPPSGIPEATLPITLVGSGGALVLGCASMRHHPTRRRGQTRHT